MRLEVSIDLVATMPACPNIVPVKSLITHVYCDLGTTEIDYFIHFEYYVIVIDR